MKYLIAALIAPIALFAAPVTAQPLAAGEVELRVEALGEIPADTAVVPVQIVGRGATAAAAKADFAKKEKEVRAGLAKLGIPATKIEAVKDDEPQYAVVTEAAYGVACATGTVPQVGSTEPVIVTTPPVIISSSSTADCVPELIESRTLLVTVEDLTKLPAIASLVEADYYIQTKGTFFHRDPKAAHDAAIAEAIAKARKDAEIYAAAMGMRVVRMVRVSNKKAPLNWPDLFGLFGGFASQIDIPDGEETAFYQVRAFAAADFAGVTIDFILAPK